MNKPHFNFIFVYGGFVQSVVVFFLFLEVLFRWLPENSLHATPELVIFIIKFVCIKEGTHSCS